MPGLSNRHLPSTLEAFFKIKSRELEDGMLYSEVNSPSIVPYCVGMIFSICFCVLFKCSGSSAHNCPGADATFNTESSWEGVAIIENRVEDESWVHPWMQRQRLWGTGGLKVLSRRIKNKSRNLQSLVIPQMFIHPSWDQRRWWSEIDQWSEIHYPLYVWRLVED